MCYGNALVMGDVCYKCMVMVAKAHSLVSCIPIIHNSYTTRGH